MNMNRVIEFISTHETKETTVLPEAYQEGNTFELVILVLKKIEEGSEQYEPIEELSVMKITTEKTEEEVLNSWFKLFNSIDTFMTEVSSN